MDKSAFYLVECCVTSKTSKVVIEEIKLSTNKSNKASCLNNLLETEAFDLHLAILKYLATTNRTFILETMLQSLVEVGIPLDLIGSTTQALPDEISRPVLSVVTSFQPELPSYSTSAESKKLQLKSGCVNEQVDSECEFCNIVKYHRNKRPTLKELANFVIPYCSSQWRILGDLLEVPANIIDNIQCDFIHVEICCREMLHTWLKRSNGVTWEDLLSALNSPVFQFHHSHPKDKNSVLHYPHRLI